MKLAELKQIIREALLNEVSYKEAQQSLDSKKFKKMIKRWYEPYKDSIRPKVGLEEYEEFVKNYIILRRFNEFDLTDNQKGLSLLWFIRYIRSIEIPATPTWSPRASKAMSAIFGFLQVRGKRYVIPKHLDLNAFHDLRRHLETFFHYNRFMSERDLNKIASPDELESITLQAAEDIKRYQEKQAYADAEQGTEVLMDNDQWYIAAIHNKGAACKLGKGTDWCTAAPGLDYFKAYYKEDDPLFYFYDKKIDAKYQFHYGTRQFMDIRDRAIDHATFDKLNTLLSKTSANKYDAYGKHYYWVGRAKDRDITREEWKRIKDTVYKRYLEHNLTARRYQIDWNWERYQS